MAEENKPPEKLPKAFLKLQVAVFIPNPDDPERGDFIEADPLVQNIFPDAENPKALPQGTITQLRELLEGMVEMARAHVPKPVPANALILPKAPPVQVGRVGIHLPPGMARPGIEKVVKPKGPPTIQAFAIGPQGQQVPLSKEVVVDLNSKRPK